MFGAVFTVLILIAIIGAALGGNSRNNTPTSRNAAEATSPSSSPIDTPTDTTTTTAQPTVTPAPVLTTATSPTASPTTKKPTTTRTPKPTPTPTRKAVSLCGAPSNPFGFNFCGRGHAIYQSTLPADVCSYFDCIASFYDGRGYMVECNDSTYSMSGGIQGACSHHSGERREVYSG